VKEPEPGLLAVSRLDGWEQQWDGLVDQAPLPSPFLRSWWLTGTAGPRRLFLLAVDGEQILHMMGSGYLCPDHMDLIVAPGEEDVTSALLLGWFQRPGSRLLDLTGVPDHSRMAEALPVPVRRVPTAVAPWTPLPDDAKAYFGGLSSQLRRNIRRASTRLTAEGADHRSHRGPSAVESLETLRTMHAAQWGNRSRFLSEFDRFVGACRLGAEADEVVVHELANDETVIATVVSFEVAGRVSLYQSARLTEPRWRNAMSVLLNAVISDACDRGFSEVDFLRGEEGYKDGFAPRRRELFRLLAATGATGRTAQRAKSAASTTRQMAVDSVRAGRTAFGRVRPER
jgi:Acetyltransferase (GNAT) domain